MNTTLRNTTKAKARVTVTRATSPAAAAPSPAVKIRAKPRKPPVIARAAAVFTSPPNPQVRTVQVAAPATAAAPATGTPVLTGTSSPQQNAAPAAAAAPTVQPDPTVPQPTPVAIPDPTTTAGAGGATVPSTPPPASPAPAAPSPVPSATADGPVMTGPPDVAVPTPPSGYMPVSAVDLRGFRPLQSELATVGDAVAEIQGIPNWGLLFGITAPPASEIAPRLQVASDWTSLLAVSSAWYVYVKSQEGMAWKDALLSMESLKAPFQLASTASPALLKQYPALARLLGAKTVVAKRGATTRATAAKTTAANNASAVAAAATAAQIKAATDAAVAAATAGVAPAPARNVTVTG
jgi:hypothetical protein